MPEPDKSTTDTDEEEPRRRALTLRTQRTWSHWGKLSQAELGALAGVSKSDVSWLENATVTPRYNRQVLDLADSLGINPFDLEIRDERHKRRQTLARRAEQFGLRRRPSAPTLNDEPRHEERCLVAIYRYGLLVVAVVTADEILAVKSHRIPPNSRKTAAMARDIVRGHVTPENIGTVIVEPGTRVETWLALTDYEREQMSLGEAKSIIVRGNACPTHENVYRQLLARYPKLWNLVSVNRHGEPKLHDRWRTVQLLAIAIGLAYFDKKSNINS